VDVRGRVPPPQGHQLGVAGLPCSTAITPVPPSPTQPRASYRDRSRRHNREPVLRPLPSARPCRLPPLTPVGPGYQRRLAKASTSSERKLGGRPATVSDPTWPRPEPSRGPPFQIDQVAPRTPPFPVWADGTQRTGWVPNVSASSAKGVEGLGGSWRAGDRPNHERARVGRPGKNQAPPHVAVMGRPHCPHQARAGGGDAPGTF
jgi:hypothetical protein